MLFKKKEDTVYTSDSNEQSARPPRYNSVAFVGINGFEGNAVLSNISIGGFCMASRTFAALKPGEKYTMQISPESSTNITPFAAEVEVRWIRSTETKFNAGFALVKPPANRAIEKYIEYLKDHYKLSSKAG